MERLRISAVVAAEEDRGRLPFLDSNQDFEPPRIVGPFSLYFARVPRLLPRAAGVQAWSLTPGREESGWIPVGFAYSPLWHAVRAGAPLPTRRDSDGMLEIETPAGAAEITLSHGPGTAERVGVMLTAASAILLAVGLVRGRGGPARLHESRS
jgi:hypothetical protein